MFHQQLTLASLSRSLSTVVGLVALVTPLSPGAWLIFIGLGLFGVRIAFWERFRAFLRVRYAAWRHR